MSHIRSLSIENYRCFEKLTIDDMTRVNVVVGKNNAGKTALLEAIEAVASIDNPFLFYRASFERGESRVRRSRGEPDIHEIDVRHWFHGHQVDLGTRFAIHATGARDAFVARTIDPIPEPAPPRPRGKSRPSDRAAGDALALAAVAPAYARRLSGRGRADARLRLCRATTPACRRHHDREPVAPRPRPCGRTSF